MPWSLRQAVYQLWCCARDTSGSPSTTAAVALAGARRSRRKLTGVFGVDMVPICIEYEALGGNADQFDQAFATKDMEALSRLLESDQAIEQLVEPKHVWAEDPRSVGALAATFLAFLASVAHSSNDSELKAEILSAETQEQLVDFLGSDEPDRVQAAVIALSYLTDQCTANAHSLHEAGALPMLIRHLDSPVAGLRGAAASTLRHMCLESEECCEQFMKLGGMQGFVNQLDPLSDHCEFMLEAVWNLEDITTDQDGNLIERYAQVAADKGALEKLARLKQFGEEEVSSAADKVLSALAQVKNRNGCQNEVGTHPMRFR